jgi:hypothetical protein
MTLSKDSALPWIGKHGSERLKKAVIEQGGLRGILEKIYLIERLAIELPGWKILRRDTLLVASSSCKIESNTLAEAQKLFPKGNICVCLSKLSCNPVLVMDCPWPIERAGGGRLCPPESFAGRFGNPSEGSHYKNEIVFYLDEKSPHFEIMHELALDDKD